MAKFQVLITSEATAHAYVTVEASTVREAEKLAIDKANEEGCEWMLDDGNEFSPYIPDPGNCAEEVLSDNLVT